MKNFLKDWNAYCKACSKSRRVFTSKHKIGVIIFAILYPIVLCMMLFGGFYITRKNNNKKESNDSDKE